MYYVRVDILASRKSAKCPLLGFAKQRITLLMKIRESVYILLLTMSTFIVISHFDCPQALHHGNIAQHVLNWEDGLLHNQDKCLFTLSTRGRSVGAIGQ